MGLLKKYNEQSNRLAYYPEANGIASGRDGRFELNPQLHDSKLDDSFDKTNLDLENSAPFGGPNNFPAYNHQQKWLPQEGKQFTDSAEGTFLVGGKLKNSYDKTSLDLTDPNPNGGPINIPYTTKVGIRTISKPTTQPYLPQTGKTYTDSLQDPLLIARATDPFR